MVLDISDAEKRKMYEVGKGLSKLQQMAMIQAFDESIIHNELERRTARHMKFEKDISGVINAYR